MRKLRRAGKIGEFVSVFVNEKQVNYSGNVISPFLMLWYNVLSSIFSSEKDNLAIHCR